MSYCLKQGVRAAHLPLSCAKDKILRVLFGKGEEMPRRYWRWLLKWMNMIHQREAGASPFLPHMDQLYRITGI